jgi:hypothetical protein
MILHELRKLVSYDEEVHRDGDRAADPALRLIAVAAVLRMHTLLHAREVVGHIHHFSTETALALLKDTGHEVVDHFFTRGAIELERQGLKTRIANLPRLALEVVGQATAQRLLGGYSLLVLCK